jgi:hypothetical protein
LQDYRLLLTDFCSLLLLWYHQSVIDSLAVLTLVSIIVAIFLPAVAAFTSIVPAAAAAAENIDTFSSSAQSAGISTTTFSDAANTAETAVVDIQEPACVVDDAADCIPYPNFWVDAVVPSADVLTLSKLEETGVRDEALPPAVFIFTPTCWNDCPVLAAAASTLPNSDVI